ncbi:MAG: hypothetical protein E7003_06850 [Eggerthellaceae bacterium]|nr:hypothetical protein [Eggerthellaceae bacterium]
MDIYEKYRYGLDGDLTRIWALRAFSAAVDGTEGRMTYKMVTDEQMRTVLDDEDYALWIEKKAKHEATKRVGT